MDYPIVTIVMTTYFPEGRDGLVRRTAARHTLKSWQKHLKYTNWLDLVIVHDGPGGVDGADNIDKFHRAALDIWTDPVLHNRATIISTEKRAGVGNSLNTGFSHAFNTTPVVLYAVDDWALTTDLDITPWVQLLMERKDVGMVRLGPPHPFTRGEIAAYTQNWQGWAMKLDRYSYAFGHRPALYHRRMIDFYGQFETYVNALRCEQDYADRFIRRTDGPDIVLALPHPWKHIDSVEQAYLNPGNNDFSFRVAY
jgi:hypothetical protein